MRSASRPVVQIVPRLGSLVDGVADYARTLAAALDANEGITTWFLCGDPRDSPREDKWRERAAKVGARSAGELAAALEKLGSHSVLLHYVNYGYAARGCPFWLIQGLARWKRRNPSARLVTMFHELYASGAPWRSSFWLSPVQRHLARTTSRIADEVVTNVELYRRRLRGWQPGRDIALMPVFSNVGEPEATRAWNTRAARIVVLGREDAARRAYRGQALMQACRALQIEQIIDIGPRSRPVPARIDGIRVSAKGFLPPAEIGAILQRSRAGFIDYPSNNLGKSTVFAAYAAHGVVPVVSWRRGEEEPGLAAGENYWSPSPGPAAFAHFESIASRAAGWYAGHSLRVQVAQFARKLRG